MHDRRALVRSAKISVWPGKLIPAACSASLLSGAVETAATWPARAASIARSTYVKPARPVTALPSPAFTPGDSTPCQSTIVGTATLGQLACHCPEVIADTLSGNRAWA